MWFAGEGGQCLRDFLDVGDAVRAIRFIVQDDVFDNEIYNVVTVNATVSQIIVTIRGSIPGVEVRLVDSPIMNQLSYRVSNLRFGRRGFEVRGDLPTGIAETIRLLRNQ